MAANMATEILTLLISIRLSSLAYQNIGSQGRESHLTHQETAVQHIS